MVTTVLVLFLNTIFTDVTDFGANQRPEYSEMLPFRRARFQGLECSISIFMIDSLQVDGRFRVRNERDFVFRARHQRECVQNVVPRHFVRGNVAIPIIGPWLANLPAPEPATASTSELGRA